MWGVGSHTVCFKGGSCEGSIVATKTLCITPPPPPPRYCHFNQVVVFLLNYELTLTLFYSLILELVKTPFTFY